MTEVKNYTIAEDSEFQSGMVDEVEVTAGGLPVELTEDQVTRLKEAGVTLETVTQRDADKAQREADVAAEAKAQARIDAGLPPINPNGE